MLYEADRDGPIEIAEPMDYRAKRFFGFDYRPQGWTADTEYIDGDSVIPSAPTGYYYTVKVCGVSGALEPTDWSLVDGTVEWSQNCYKALPLSDSITASTWTATNSVTTSNASFDATSTRVMVATIPVGTESFTLTNHTIRSSGEEDYRSMIIQVRTT